MLKKLLADYLNKKHFVRGNGNKNNYAGALYRAWGHVYNNFMEGDYLEFGVYKGDSLIESYKNYLQFREWIDDQVKSEEPWRVKSAEHFIDHIPRFHALDTFDGMPENEESRVLFARGDFLSNFDEVKKRCEREGLIEPQLRLYKGLFKAAKDQLYKHMSKRAVIINIDCDLYSSAKDALELCEPFIQSGTVLLFDDYNVFSADNEKGERKAFREFCEVTKHKFESWFPYFYGGQSFLCVG